MDKVGQHEFLSNIIVKHKLWCKTPLEKVSYQVKVTLKETNSMEKIKAYDQLS